MGVPRGCRPDDLPRLQEPELGAVGSNLCQDKEVLFMLLLFSFHMRKKRRAWADYNPFLHIQSFFYLMWLEEFP